MSTSTKKSTNVSELIPVNAYNVINVSTKEYIAYLASNGYILPDFQRPEVWTASDELGLLTTIKNGEPMPTFILGEATEGGKFIIDGQQRTKTIKHLMDLFHALPTTLEAIQDYMVTIQLVNGSTDALQALYTRVNAKSGLTKCQKVEGQFKGDVALIKNMIKGSAEVKVLYTKTTKKEVGEMKLEVAISGKVSDISVYLTQAEIMPTLATTNATEVEKALTGNVSVSDMDGHIDRIPKRLEALFQVMSNEVIAKATKANFAYPVAVYVLSAKYSVQQITDGMLSMFTSDGTGRQPITDDVIIIGTDGGKVKYPVTSEMLFGGGSTNNREATQKKICFIENRIKEVTRKRTVVKAQPITSEEERILQEASK